MGDNTNLLTLSKSAINAIKKPELVQKIIALKERLSWILIYQNRCNQISKLNDTISQLHCTNEKIRSELAVLKNINTKMEERIIKLEKIKPNRSSTAGVITLNYLVFRMLYQKIIWRKFWLTFATILVWKSSQKTLKGVIVYQLLDIENRKHPKALLRNKKFISSKDFPHLNGKVFFFCFSLSLLPVHLG